MSSRNFSISSTRKSTFVNSNSYQNVKPRGKQTNALYLKNYEVDHEDIIIECEQNKSNAITKAKAKFYINLNQQIDNKSPHKQISNKLFSRLVKSSYALNQLKSELQNDTLEENYLRKIVRADDVIVEKNDSDQGVKTSESIYIRYYDNESYKECLT